MEKTIDALQKMLREGMAQQFKTLGEDLVKQIGVKIDTLEERLRRVEARLGMDTPRFPAVEATAELLASVPVAAALQAPSLEASRALLEENKEYLPPLVRRKSLPRGISRRVGM